MGRRSGSPSSRRGTPSVSEWVVRAYTGADEDEVVALWEEVFPGSPRRNDPRLDASRKQASQPGFFLVAARDGRIVGTAMGGYDGHRGWVHRMAVAPAERRSGIGAALMQRLERDLDAAGCPKLNLQVRGDNEAVIAFYRRLGYEVEDRVSLGKTLPGAPGEEA
jgi:ribosomal protein S18 acetylase RimI-like enzyme